MAEESHFFIVGAQRSGTTYLYKALCQHPEIEMAVPEWPEPKYFIKSELYERGLAYYESQCFPGKPGARLRGEKSTSYIEFEIVAQRLKEGFPNARLIFVLRNPIERAISNYWFSVKNGLENMPMPEAFLHEEERFNDYDHNKISVSPYTYLRRGRYINYIDVYRRYFADEQIQIVIFEALVTSRDVLRNLYEFLGVNSEFTPAGLDQKVNGAERRTDSALSPELKAHLVDYFSATNARLADYLNLDLAQYGW